MLRDNAVTFFSGLPGNSNPITIHDVQESERGFTRGIIPFAIPPTPRVC